MAKVYLMLSDLPTETEGDVSLGWAVDWGTEDGAKPDELSPAQEAAEQFLRVLERIPWAQRGKLKQTEAGIILLPGTVT